MMIGKITKNIVFTMILSIIFITKVSIYSVRIFYALVLNHSNIIFANIRLYTKYFL